MNLKFSDYNCELIYNKPSSALPDGFTMMEVTSSLISWPMIKKNIDICCNGDSCWDVEIISANFSALGALFPLNLRIEQTPRNNMNSAFQYFNQQQ